MVVHPLAVPSRYSTCDGLPRPSRCRRPGISHHHQKLHARVQLSRYEWQEPNGLAENTLDAADDRASQRGWDLISLRFDLVDHVVCRGHEFPARVISSADTGSGTAKWLFHHLDRIPVLRHLYSSLGRGSGIC